MYNPTLRLLTILELLQAREQMSGTELAEVLEVDIRSVRRYMTMLQDLGIPVVSSRGRYGTYRLRPGFKLPPLMFTEEEAVAVTLGLMTIQSNGLSFSAPSVEGAKAKVTRVLPERLRERIQILQQVVALRPESNYFVIRVRPELVLQISEAVYRRQQVWLCYSSRKDEQTERLVDPYGLAYWMGRWYMIGYCHLRKDLRAYRLDRIITAQLKPDHFEALPDFDCNEYLLNSFGTFAHTWEIEVILEMSLAEAQRKIPKDYGTVQTRPDGVLYSCRVDDLMDTALFLVNLRCNFVVARPPELQTALGQLANQISELATRRLVTAQD